MEGGLLVTKPTSNLALHSSSLPLYFVTQNGHFDFNGKRISVDLEEPVDGDIIRGTAKFSGGPQHFLGDASSFGFPGPAPAFRAEDEIELDLEFSRSKGTLTRMIFSVEMHQKNLQLIPGPVSLVLEGVSFHITIFEPLHSSRAVSARLAAEVVFGDESDGAFRLWCGGSYPNGNLFLQSRESLPIGSLIEKLVGPSRGLEKLKFDDLRIDYNYRAGYFALSMDVKGPWEIVKGFSIGDIHFEIEGIDSYTGQLAAALKIAGVDVYLSALYDQGWQFEGSTGTGQAIPIGELLVDLGEKFGMDADHPAALESLEFKNLSVSFNTATKDFSFKGEADFWVDGKHVDGKHVEGTGTKVLIEVSIDIRHQSDGSAQKRFSGVIKVGTNEFDVVFDKEEITLDGKAVEISTLVAAYQSTADGFSIRDLVPDGYNVPDIKTRGAFIARQSKKPGDGKEATTSKWLLGLSLEAGLDLSNVKLPNIPLMGSGGPPKSLKLDLQVLVATKPFTDADLGIIGGLNATGGVSVPSHAVESVAVATVLYMDGKTVTLNLPIISNPEADTKAGDSPFGDDPGSAKSAADPAVVVTPDDGTKWVKIQKNFGPIHVERVGLKYKDQKLFIFLDGGLTAAGFTLSLEGLGVDTPLTKLDPHFHLSGIGLEYKGSGGMELGGAFLKQEITDPETGEVYPAYAGEAVLKTDSLSLSAMGSFFKYRGESSLFVYALLDYPLGGPPFFFVTGLAAGFGFNRRAIIPPVEQIHTYPLVTKAIAGPPAKGAPKTNLVAELAALEAFIPPALGEIFLAVGVKFTSFKLVDSFALIIAQFGAENQFDLVGVSHLQIPSKEAGGASGSPLAEINMNWHGFFRPEEGLVGLKAELAPGSYVFSPDCHLTGEFAYYAWFAGPHAGDFVYTVGGYHPDFHYPDHYPVVPRLQFNWIVKQANLHLKGELYYALTGHAFMAGGKLDASIHGGFDIGIAGVNYSANLHVAADFLITWEPYHYDAAVSLDLHIDISAHLFFFSKSFSLNVGGDMHIWGPDFAGEAHIYLKVLGISHTLDVTFGAGPPKLRPITWERFATAFLPQPTPPPTGQVKQADNAATAVPPRLVDPHAICGVSVKRGLIRASDDRWVINAKEFCLVTDSMIPINGVLIVNDEKKGASLIGATDFGIAPMGIPSGDLKTVHHVKITRDGKPAAELFRFEPIFKNVPGGMWDNPQFVKGSKEFLEKPKVNPDRQLVSGVLGGLEVLPAVLPHCGETLPVDRRELQYDTDRIGSAYQWETMDAFVAEQPPEADWKKKINETILITGNDAEPWKLRKELLNELGLGLEEIYFGQPVNSYLSDAPQFEKIRKIIQC